MLVVTLFSRENCHLCDVAVEDLSALRKKYPHQVLVINVDENPDLQRAYGENVPVVEIGPYRLKAPFSRQKLEITLGAALDRQTQLIKVDDVAYKTRIKRGKEISRADRFTYWIARNYVSVLNILLLLYIGLPFLAPVFMRVGKPTPARVIYRVYGGLCHQLAYRSWFLFGQQAVYPREAAGLDNLASFGELTGFSEADTNEARWEARNFVGNEAVGYKVAYCQRDIAIYGSILLFGLVFGLSRRKIKPLPFIFWIVIGLVPIGVDGVSQLISNFVADPNYRFLQSFFGFLPYRESTPFLRTVTGILFGLSTAWFGYPLVEETMADARRLLATKYVQVKEGGN